jgi:hypothetical protein
MSEHVITAKLLSITSEEKSWTIVSAFGATMPGIQSSGISMKNHHLYPSLIINQSSKPTHALAVVSTTCPSRIGSGNHASNFLLRTMRDMAICIIHYPPHAFALFHIMSAFPHFCCLEVSLHSSAVQAPFAFGDWKSTTSSEALVLDPQPPIGHRGCAMQSAAKLNHWWIR